jgi:tetratricopeptide (TPR) repeat protein
MDYYQRGTDLTIQMDYEAAIEMFTKGLEEYPDDSSLFDRRAVAYRYQGKIEEAIADFTRVTELNPRNADGWNSRGNLYRNMGQYDKAIADFTQCIPLSPKNYGTYWSNRGIAYYEKGDLDAALADLNQSIACWADPECSDWALLHRGLVWEKKGDMDKALDDFNLAARLNPENDEAFYHAGYIWFMRKDYERAIECFSGAIAAREEEANNWLARGASYWNICVKDKINFWEKRGKLMDQAIDDFTKAIECAPDRAEAYRNRGAIRCAKAQDSNGLIKTIAAHKAVDEGQRMLLLAQLEQIGGKDLVPQTDAVLRGVRSNRDQVEVLVAKTLCLFAEDDAREAIEDLSRAIELESGNADAHHQRGIAYSLLGRKAEALADYEQACAFDPGHSRAAEKRDALRKNRE